VVFWPPNPGGSSAVLRGLNTETRPRASPTLKSPKRFPITLFDFLLPVPAPVPSMTHWASQYDPPLHLQPMAVTAQLFLAQQPLYLLKYSHSFFALVFRRSRPHSLTSFVTLSNRPLNWLAFWLISGSRFKHLRDINVPSPPRQLT
jgi:hypothetical protein